MMEMKFQYKEMEGSKSSFTSKECMGGLRMPPFNFEPPSDTNGRLYAPPP